MWRRRMANFVIDCEIVNCFFTARAIVEAMKHLWNDCTSIVRSKEKKKLCVFAGHERVPESNSVCFVA